MLIWKRYQQSLHNFQPGEVILQDFVGGPRVTSFSDGLVMSTSREASSMTISRGRRPIDGTPRLGSGQSSEQPPWRVRRHQNAQSTEQKVVKFCAAMSARALS